MYIKKTCILNATGLHARPASEFVNRAKQFKSVTWIMRSEEENPRKAKCTSIIMVLSLGLAQHTKVTVMAEGEDEKEAVEQLVALIESGFGE